MNLRKEKRWIVVWEDDEVTGAFLDKQSAIDYAAKEGGSITSDGETLWQAGDNEDYPCLNGTIVEVEVWVQ
jgi:hypothetical protein